ncbi:MAG: DUF885 family protein [Bacteroidota bacterium]
MLSPLRVRHLWFAVVLPALAVFPALAPATPTLRTITIPGEPHFVAIAKDIVDVRFALDPSIAGAGGLFDDAGRVPSFDPAAVAALTARLDADLAELRAMPWRDWSVDRRIDWRWVYAIAQDARLQLTEEKLYLHRPASWLEPLANNYVALLTYAPRRIDIRKRLARAIPGMVAEMRRVALSLTARDAEAARGIAAGIVTMLAMEDASPGRDSAAAALSSYIRELKAERDLPEISVIGAARYEERLRCTLLPWTPRQLLAVAQHELAETDARMAELRARLSPPPEPTPAHLELAQDLDQEGLLRLYDEITRTHFRFLDTSDLLTVPAGVGPVLTRPTPEAMIPLSGDGGSMNPPPALGESNVGWWNVEHVKPDWTLEQKAGRVATMQQHRRTWMGPYAVHEGVPGHHLQLSIARLNPNPLRSLFQDNSLVEGWAMYAEEIFWRAGGLGDTPEAEYNTLGGWRFRIRRVFYDVHTACGDWTLQEAADFKDQARRGKGSVDDDILRAINWPAQLVGYFAGKMQILDLKAAYRKKLGPEYTERGFHDALLAEGSIPVVLIRAKLLGEAVPEP